MSRPSVSVCIPSHRPLLLTEAMASVERQTYRDFELLVNASTHYWPGKINVMPLHAASGSHLLTLCDDDRLHPDALTHMVAEAERGHPLVFSDYQNFGDRTDLVRAGPYIHEGFRETNPLLGLSYLIDTTLFRELGGFDEAQVFQDWDLGYRCWLAGVRAAYISRPLVEYRWHDGMGSRGIDYHAARGLLYRKHPQLLKPHDVGDR